LPYEPPSLVFSKDSEKASNFQTAVDSDAATAPLVHEQQFGVQFSGEDNSFCFTRIELFAKRRNLRLVLGCDDARSLEVKLDFSALQK
jgi:hypothetical protein